MDALDYLAIFAAMVLTLVIGARLLRLL